MSDAGLDLGRLGRSLTLDADGIWVARGTPAVSYPDGGHAACLEVEDASFWFAHRNRCILACVQRLGPGGHGPFFDVGAGNGFVARALAGAGLQVVAIEPGPQGARNARRRGLQHVVRATTDVCGFEPGCAAAAGAFDVIEHVPDDVQFLAELRRLVKPGGRVFATVPAYSALWSDEDVAAGHYRRYTLPTISAAMAKAGFQVEYSTYFFRWLVVPILLARVAPYRLGLRRGGSSADTDAREHGTRGGGAAALRLLQSEVARVAAGRSMSFGASLLLAAR